MTNKNIFMGDFTDRVTGCGILGLVLFLATNVVLIIFMGIYINLGTGVMDANDMAQYMPIKLSRVRASQQEVTSTLERGWTTEPFIDVITVDTSSSSTSGGGCPAAYPDEVIYDVWPGT